MTLTFWNPDCCIQCFLNKWSNHNDFCIMIKNYNSASLVWFFFYLCKYYFLMTHSWFISEYFQHFSFTHNTSSTSLSPEKLFFYHMKNIYIKCVIAFPWQRNNIFKSFYIIIVTLYLFKTACLYVKCLWYLFVFKYVVRYE